MLYLLYILLCVFIVEKDQTEAEKKATLLAQASEYTKEVKKDVSLSTRDHFFAKHAKPCLQKSDVFITHLGSLASLTNFHGIEISNISMPYY